MNYNDYALVIEDSASMRNSVSAILRQQAHIDHVIETGDPDQALELIRRQSGRPALIVSDWNMPGGSLENLLHALKSCGYGKPPLVLLTASSADMAREIAATLEADAVLTKPVSAAALTALIERHIAGGERRRARRIIPLNRCEVDLGFNDTHPTYSAEVLNLSTNGILIRLPAPAPGIGCIHDFASLTLLPDDGAAIKVYGQVVRLEADPDAEHQHCDTLLMAFHFGPMDAATQRLLQRYLADNDGTATAASAAALPPRHAPPPGCADG